MSTSPFSQFRSDFQVALRQVVTTIELRRQKEGTIDLTQAEKAAIIEGVQASVKEAKKPVEGDVGRYPSSNSKFNYD